MDCAQAEGHEYDAPRLHSSSSPPSPEYFNKYRHPSQPLYNGMWVKGKLVQEGERITESRYELIRSFCRHFGRPFSVLDIGAAEGYFTFRLAEDFPGVFTAIECDKQRHLLDLCKENDNDKVILMEALLDYESLQRLAAVNHFDVVLALNIVHHFDEHFQKVVDTIMSMCSYCFFEHPDPKEGEETKNYERLVREPINVSKYGGTLLDLTPRWSGAKTRLRQTFLLNNSQALSSQRVSTVGLNLRSFIDNEGVYPGVTEMLYLIDKLKEPTSGFRDYGPANLVLSGNELNFVDAQTYSNISLPVWSKEQLKRTVKELV